MKRRFMSRARFLFVIAVLAGVAFLVVAVSGFVLWLILPTGPGVGMAWHHHTWLDIHEWTAVVLAVIIVVHVYVHRKWLNQQIRSLFKVRQC